MAGGDWGATWGLGFGEWRGAGRASPPETQRKTLRQSILNVVRKVVPERGCPRRMKFRPNLHGRLELIRAHFQLQKGWKLQEGMEMLPLTGFLFVLFLDRGSFLL